MLFLSYVFEKMIIMMMIIIIIINYYISGISIRHVKSSHKIDFGDGKFLSGVDIIFSSTFQPIRGYFGIRYASLGKMKNAFYTENRFQPPVASFFYEEFEGTVIKDKFSPVCPQNFPNMSEFDNNPQLFNSYWHHIKRILPYLTLQDEECLTLNLYVPESNHSAVLPVLLFIHGESFELGSGNAYDLSVLSSYGQIIAITFNYRLGLLGFFKSEDDKAIGNYALFDIYAALQWISNNIHRFNGDPDNVTILGYGHGAALAHLFALSKLLQDSKKKSFHRLIILNGDGLANWSRSQFPHMYMDALKTYLNISQNKIFDFLKHESISNILLAIKSTPSVYFSSHIGPTISNMFFKYTSDSSRKVIPSNPSFYRNLDIMVGLNGNNAGFFFNTPFHLKAKDFTEKHFQNKIKEFIKENYIYNQQSIYEILLYMYTDWKKMESKFEYEIRDSRVLMFTKMLNDAFFVAPAIQLCNMHSASKPMPQQAGKTFLYLFSKSQTKDKRNIDDDAQYSDDLNMLFGMPLIPSFESFSDENRYSYNDGQLSKQMMTYLSNFIKYGNPNDPKLSSKRSDQYYFNDAQTLEYWPPYTISQKHYISFNVKAASTISIKSNLQPDQFRVWNDLIPKLHNSFNFPMSYHKQYAVRPDTKEKRIQNDYNYNLKFITLTDPIISSTSKTCTSTPPLRTLKLDVSFPKREKPDYDQERTYEKTMTTMIKEDSFVDTMISTTYNIRSSGLIWTIFAGVGFFLINSIAIMYIYMNVKKLKSLRETSNPHANNCLSPLRSEFDNDRSMDTNVTRSDLKNCLDLKNESVFLISNQSPDMLIVSSDNCDNRLNTREIRTSYFTVNDNDPVTIV